MPRHGRVQSRSGYMHLIVRGIGKQILFEDTEDYNRFLSTLERFCMETGVRVCAYCLMENHVHLLIYDKKKNVSLMMKKLEVSYSMYFNRKYERSGHLFQDRYLSENVENDSYLLTVFRYILNNPHKAGICTTQAYPWSSYRQYEHPAPFMDLRLIRHLLGHCEQYTAFLHTENRDLCLEWEKRKHDDQWALDIIKKSLHVKSGTALQNFSRKERNEALRVLKKHGISIRQIERLTGINRNIVQKA